MKISDLLRALADQVDGAQPDPVVGKAIHHITKIEADPANSTDEEEPTQFLPPLQAKLELLKRSEDLPNVYDDHDDNNTIRNIRKNAGIKSSSISLSDDDGPFEE
jgi:hypothetical protein|tara:strand:- start:790 stop:1104 length:315 start_codon:yes stop_codon:yes gene_type:complete